MIRIIAPDLPRPSGGMQVIYAFARTLNDAGMHAAVWHGTPGFGYPELPSTPIVSGREQHLEPGDVLVMLETGGPKWSLLLSDSIPAVMLCQGTDFVFQNTEFGQHLEGDYPGWPTVHSAIAVSESIAEFLAAACPPSFPVYTVPVVIDTERYVPREKRRTVAFMPRRRREDLLAAVALANRRPELDGWQWLPIDGMPPAQVAEHLGHAAVFLSGAEREGFGLPGAEAMAAGCHVVGFTGHGAKEYMRPGLASVIAESDVVAMADRIAAAAREFDSDRATFDKRSAASRQLIAERYSAERMRDALVEAFERILESDAVIRESVTVRHYQAFAPKQGLVHETYRGARRLARRAIDAVKR